MRAGYPLALSATATNTSGGGGGGARWCRNVVLACVCGLLALQGMFAAVVYWRYRWQSDPLGYAAASGVVGGAVAAAAGEGGGAGASSVTAHRDPSAPASLAEQHTLQDAIDAVPASALTIAWAIPVGGRTRRAKALHAITSNLLTHGVRASDVFVFEDVLSRPDGRPDEGVAEVAKELALRVVPDFVKREGVAGSTAVPFGLFLSRHYKFMLDFVFVPGARAQASAAAGATGAAAAAVVDADADTVYDFVVIIEDDLHLAPDTVKYFTSMARVMAVDPTLYCACAHQDNAFMATSLPDSEQTRMALTGFDFRRGNHFMAPGWMTTGRVYRDIVRPTWLDADGQLIHGTKYIPNGHWDRFWDARIDDKDCIFPANPRIVHAGADGFTVSKTGQLELYENIRLAAAPAPATHDVRGNPIAVVGDTVDYGDLWRLTARGYEYAVEAFLREAVLVSVLEQLALYRYSKLVYVVEADDDRDTHWNHILANHFGIIGLGGYGGHNRYAKLRGVHKGSVVVSWLSNTVMIVGTYSPYVALLARLGKRPAQLPSGPVTFRAAGCYTDKWERDLSVLIHWYSARNLSPARCALSCHILGYGVAGLQAGMECWCGNSYGKYGLAGAGPTAAAAAAAAATGTAVDGGECAVCPVMMSSGSSWLDGAVNAVSRLVGVSGGDVDIPGAAVADPPAATASSSSSSHPPFTCGGALKNSIYVITPPPPQRLAPAVIAATATAGGRAYLKPSLHATSGTLVTPYARGAAPDDLAFVKAAPGQSCTDACKHLPLTSTRAGALAGAVSAAVGAHMACHDHWLPYIHQNCPLLRDIMGCDSCVHAPGADMATFTPYRTDAARECFVAKASFLSCGATPPPPGTTTSITRACVCQFVPGSGGVMNPKLAFSKTRITVG